MQHAAGIAITIALTACSPLGLPATKLPVKVASVVSPRECPAPAIDTSGWQSITVSERGFLFKVPPNYRKTDVSVPDLYTYMGKWAVSERQFVLLEYGTSASTLEEAKSILQDYTDCSIRTNDMLAKIVVGYDANGRWSNNEPKQVAAAAWRNVHPGIHLALTASGTNIEELPVLYAIVRSVYFVE